MNKLVSKNPVQRFKLNFIVTTLKTGGNIPKLETGWQPIKWEKNKQQKGAEDFVNKTIESIAKVTKPIEESTKKASNRNKKTTALQLQLWNSGAFNGVIDKRTGKQVTYERAVDGLMGRMTRQAMENSKKKRESISLSPRKEVTQSQQQNNKSKQFINPYPEISAAQTAYEQFAGNNFPKSDGTTYIGRFLNNLYPYGYQDNPGKADLYGFISKLAGGFVGKSDRKKYLDEIIDLDLNDPEQLEKAQSYKDKFDNFKYSDIKYIQQSARLREDLNRLYAGMPQKYNSFIINPDYESATAKSKGVPTYTFADPELRKQYQKAGLTFNKTHDIGVYSTSDNQKSVFNRFSTVKSNQDGSGKYLEEWDFLGIPGANKVYIGDTIPSNVGKGQAFIENHDNTPTNFIDFIKSLIKNR